MQRDDDYIRALMIEMEAGDEWVHHIWCDGTDPADEKRYYHALMLADAGALEVRGAGMDKFRIRDQGYSLLGVMRKDEDWEWVKRAARQAGGYGIKTLMSVAESYIMQKLREAGVLP